MRSMRRDFDQLSRADHLLAAVEDELERAALHHGDLFVYVAMPRNYGVLLHIEPGDGHLLYVNHLAGEARIELFFRNGVPLVESHGAILIRRLAARAPGPRISGVARERVL